MEVGESSDSGARSPTTCYARCGTSHPPTHPYRLWHISVLPTRNSTFRRSKSGSPVPNSYPPLPTSRCHLDDETPVEGCTTFQRASLQGLGLWGRRASRENLQTALHSQKLEACRAPARPPRGLSQTPTPARSAQD